VEYSPRDVAVENSDREPVSVKAGYSPKHLKTLRTIMGTAGRELAPWKDYGQKLVGQDDESMRREVALYAQNRHETSSDQAKEVLAEKKELSDLAAREYQWVHPSEYADHGPRMGRIMHSSKLISILRAMGLKCWYRQHPQAQKLTLLVLERGHRNAGCWVQGGYMPEYSIMRFDDHGVPLDEAFRGWRTVLMQLALKQLISERQINEVFGQARGPAASRYQKFMGSLRTNFLRGQ